MKYILALVVSLFLSLSLSFFSSHHAFAADDDEEEPAYTIIVEPKQKKKKGGGGCVSCGNITVTVTNTGEHGEHTVINYKIDRPNKMTNEEKALFQRCKELLSQISISATIAGVRRFEFENNVGKNSKTLRMEALDEQKEALAEFKEAGCDSLLGPQLPDLVNSFAETGGYGYNQ